MSEKEEKKTKDELIQDFIKSFDMIEKAIEPYKDSRRALREDYSERGLLTKDEMSMAVKAYRMMKSEVDFQELGEMYQLVKRMRGQ